MKMLNALVINHHAILMIETLGCCFFLHLIEYIFKLSRILKRPNTNLRAKKFYSSDYANRLPFRQHEQYEIPNRT